MVELPRLVVAAAASGQGKTSIATGLLAAFRARGVEVSPHKVGPDYIDPGYHGLAAGRVGRNLDPWLVGEDRIVPLFLHAALTPRPARLAVIEGVMGLFDGASGHGGFASTAHVATLLGAPVVLVVDAAATGRSVAALVHGFTTFDPSVRIGGVILNRVGSQRHRLILDEALAETGVPVLGAIARHDALVTPSRHLGLVPAAERAAEAVATVQRLGEVVAAGVDLDAVLRLAQSAPPLHAEPWSPTPPGDHASTRDHALAGDHASVRDHASAGDQGTRARTRRPVIAVAGGPAFTFSYAENTELLAAAGADAVPFDPLHDEHLPAGTRGLVIGGGFPEVHAARLAENRTLLAEVAQLADRRGPVTAECAGLLYLARSLDGEAMAGVLPADATMTARLRIGYREAVALTDSVLAPAGTRVRGHEFHRTACEPGASTERPAWGWRGSDGECVVDGFVTDLTHASYLHLHWAGSPSIASRIVAAAREECSG